MATQNNNQTTNIDLSVLRKKRFTIDGDENRILELNTSDLRIVGRLSEAYPRLVELGNKSATLSEGTSDGSDESKAIEDLGIISNNLNAIDKEMRDEIDYIFNSNVSEMCASDGSMYDPIGGQLRYEHILTILIALFEDNLSAEMTRVKNQMNSHTGKYTKKK